MVARIVIGDLPGGTKGIRVSEAGYDVLTNSPNDEYLTFNSDFPNALSIETRGLIAVTGATNGTEVSQAITLAGFTYKPHVMVFFKGNGIYNSDFGSPQKYLQWRNVITNDVHWSDGDLGTGWVRVQVLTTEVRFYYRRARYASNDFNGYPTAVQFAYTIFRTQAA